MRNIRQLFWGHGEFLAPQHLQQLDLFHIERLTRAVRGMQPHQWGVARLEVREEGLAAGEFDATDCELVTRDGLILVAGPERAGNSARLAPRSFQGMMDPAQGPLAVYLAVARHQPDGRNLVVDEQPVAGGAAGGPAAARRYRVARREVADMFADDAPEHEVAYAEYEVAVLFGRDPEIDAAARGFELVKVAELTAMET
ncbi:MAG: type VI secretion system baseplate subunit TssK, partial [Alphaproteobacteria bacterium]